MGIEVGTGKCTSLMDDVQAGKNSDGGVQTDSCLDGAGLNTIRFLRHPPYGRQVVGPPGISVP